MPLSLASPTVSCVRRVLRNPPSSSCVGRAALNARPPLLCSFLSFFFSSPLCPLRGSPVAVRSCQPTIVEYVTGEPSLLSRASSTSLERINHGHKSSGVHATPSRRFPGMRVACDSTQARSLLVEFSVRKERPPVRCSDLAANGAPAYRMLLAHRLALTKSSALLIPPCA